MEKGPDFTWVCLKIGYIPNEIAISKRDMISKTIGFRDTLFSDTLTWIQPRRILNQQHQMSDLVKSGRFYPTEAVIMI